MRSLIIILHLLYIKSRLFVDYQSRKVRNPVTGIIIEEKTGLASVF